MFFFFKQKTAYEMRISDWSSDVCSSDLHSLKARAAAAINPDASTGSAATGSAAQGGSADAAASTGQPAWARRLQRRQQLTHAATTVAHTLRGGDRKSVV